MEKDKINRDIIISIETFLHNSHDGLGTQVLEHKAARCHDKENTT